MITDNQGDAGNTQALVREKVRELQRSLAGRQPGEVLADLVEAIKRVTDSLTDKQVRIPERPGKWSILEVLHHLADMEMVYGIRVRTVLAEDRPNLQSIDETAWAANLRYNEANVSHVLEQLAWLRRVNLRLFQGLTSAQWNRLGVHNERGPESVYVIVLAMAVHDGVHLRQISRIRDSL